MKKRFLAIIAIGLLSLLFAAHVSAGTVMERILEEKVLRVGTTGAQPPMTATTKGGELIGMDVDLAKAMASAMGVEVKFVTMPFEKLLPAVETGVVDMVVSGLTMTPERNRTIAFVGPYYVSGKGILGKSSKYAQLQQAEGLNAPDVTVAVLKGSTSQEFAEQLMPKAKKVPATSYEEAIELLRKDEADVMVADYPFCALTAYRKGEVGIAEAHVQV